MRAAHPESLGVRQVGENALWTDSDFDAAQRAFYYVRVLKIPTPRRVCYDVLRFGTELPEEAKMITQERAYTTLIWYTP